MALTYTLAGLQSVLDSVESNISSGDWAAALKHVARAELVLAGLPQSAASDTQTVTMRASIASAKDLILAARKATVDNRRTLRAGVRHLTSGPGRRERSGQ